MKNLLNKFRKNNKGFTLVELIIVIAIIAVLSAVIAPQYIKYVENSKMAVDENTRDELKHAVEIAIVDASVYEKLPSADGGTATLTYKAGESAYGGTCDATLTSKVTETLTPAAMKAQFPKSKTYAGKTITITVKYTAATKSYSVEASLPAA
ncbi:prepilin-type N-terminal cleavage/methylation domain-containing protein [Oscillibacter sp.]|uniref:prepilin-type N-terminal cleavage/methylation domain-containing protein n=1 Tax=Oscillibacter sp. TaxID=1945593 RepID=UPI002630C4E4|nr:prepilin-type N-terminal cleavage/methylation domain-containing protein [Oscillibacter sp.]MDD3347409.1 prepilin-type N-terminal cleavage/methylation domain-containing protein [Oscillibacter sp.]